MDKPNDILKAMDTTFVSVVRLVIKQANPIDNKWISNKGNHSVIRNKCLISQATLEKHLRKMKDKKILLKAYDAGRGVYIINREMIAYGRE